MLLISPPEIGFCPDYEHPYNDNHCQKLSVFSRVNATLEAAMSVGRSVGRSVTFLKLSLNLHFKGILGFFRVL